MSRTELLIEPTNPVDLVENLASHKDWSFERSGDYEISLVVEGVRCSYQVSFQWLAEIEVLHLGCAFDLVIPEQYHLEALKLAAAANERLWLGHFDLWREERHVMYRSSLLLPDGVAASSAQCDCMLVRAVEALDRYYPAFNFVVWAGKTAKEAMDEITFETEGNA